MEVIQILKRQAPSIPILAISGGGRIGSVEYLSVARALGASAILEKPIDPDLLEQAINQLI